MFYPQRSNNPSDVSGRSRIRTNQYAQIVLVSEGNTTFDSMPSYPGIRISVRSSGAVDRGELFSDDAILQHEPHERVPA